MVASKAMAFKSDRKFLTLAMGEVEGLPQLLEERTLQQQRKHGNEVVKRDRKLVRLCCLLVDAANLMKGFSPT